MPTTLRPTVTRYSNVVAFEGEGMREVASLYAKGARQTLTGVCYPKAEFPALVAALARAGYHVVTPKGL